MLYKIFLLKVNSSPFCPILLNKEILSQQKFAISLDKVTFLSDISECQRQSKNDQDKLKIILYDKMFIIFLGIKSINLTNISRQGYNKSFNTFLNELWLFLPSSPSNAFILSFDSGSSTTIATVALEVMSSP